MKHEKQGAYGSGRKNPGKSKNLIRYGLQTGIGADGINTGQGGNDMDTERLERPYISRVAWECVKFYQDPENIKAFHEWLNEKRQKEAMREDGC
jgi:hypothetical protein